MEPADNLSIDNEQPRDTMMMQSQKNHRQDDDDDEDDDDDDDPVARYYEELCHQILQDGGDSSSQRRITTITNLDLTWGFDNYWARRIGEALLQSMANPTTTTGVSSIHSLHITLQHLQHDPNYHTQTTPSQQNHHEDYKDGGNLEESLMDFLKYIRTCKTLQRITLEIGNAPVYLTCRFFLAMEANPNIQTIILKLLHRHPVGLDTLLLHSSSSTTTTTTPTMDLELTSPMSIRSNTNTTMQKHPPHHAHVKRFELHMCTMGEESFDFVAHAIANNTSIERLELHCGMLYSAFVIPILNALHRQQRQHHNRIHHLVLSCGQARDYIQTGPALAVALQQFLESSSTLRILELSQFEFTDVSQFRPVVRGVLASPSLVDLRFFGDCWFDETCRTLFEQEVRPRIRHIRIS
jgi:hypothetical protein